MRINYLIFALIFPISLLGQKDYSECQILQINVQDSSQKHISRIQRFDSLGNLVYEKYQNYKTDFQHGKVDGEYYYQYKNHQLEEKRFVQKSIMGNRFDTTKTIFFYKKGVLIQEETYKFTRKLVQNRQNSTLEFPRDFLPEQWYLIGRKKFFYNNTGKLIEEYAPDTFYSSQNRYKYEYDSAGRMIKKYSLNDDRLIWTEDYKYLQKKEIMTRTWEHEGKIEKWSNPLFWRFERFYDGNGNLIREESYYNKLNKKNVFHGFDTYSYDKNNKLVKFMSFRNDKEAQIIHKYIYK